MSKIDPNANLYDIDGNLISKAPLPTKTINEVEELVDTLTKKVQENPDNEVYKVYLNNAQSFLFGMYNHMSKEDLVDRLSVLQNSIQTAKNEANEAEKDRLDSANKALEELKESFENVDEKTSAPLTQEDMLVDRDVVDVNNDEYVQFEELPVSDETSKQFEEIS